MGDLTQEFTFTVTGLTGSCAYKKYSTTDGTNWSEMAGKGGTLTPDANTFTLAHHQKIVIENLPLNTTITVTEVHGDYTVTVTPDASEKMTEYYVSTESGKTNGASFKLKDNAELRVTNDYPAVAPTGITFRVLPFLLILGAGVLIALARILGRKRRDDE